MLEIKSELRNDKVVPVLYQDGEEVMVIPKKIVRGEELMDIPEKYLKLLDKQAESVGEEDTKQYLDDLVDEELVPEPTPFNNYASMMNRRSMTTPEKKIKYVEHDDPKARMKPSPKPKPPKQFSSFKSLKHMDEGETDILVQQITDRVMNRLSGGEEEDNIPVKKGFLRMLLGATAMNELLSNRDKEERKRLQEEFDRTYYRRKN